MKKVLLLGLSGNIGQQTIDVLKKYNKDFLLVGFSVGYHHELIEDVLKEFPSVKYIYLRGGTMTKHYRYLYRKVTFYTGESGLKKLIRNCRFDICVNALVGFVGLEPSIQVLKKNKILCLANKEALVTGGTLINALLNKHKGKLYPIDSEHVAVAKCLSKCSRFDVKRIILTASGGALRDWPIDKLAKAKASDALKHPNWHMGDKITIDCATMMNKGFEVIEAFYLFNFPLEQIDVLMHKESLVHSMVQLNDGSYLLDYGHPDMRTCIEYALFEGKNKFNVLHVNSLSELKDCHFFSVDLKRYPLFEFARSTLVEGGTKLVVLNAADEVAVNAFLAGKIGFLDIVDVIKKIVSRHSSLMFPTLNEIKLIDKKSKEVTEIICSTYYHQ